MSEQDEFKRTMEICEKTIQMMQKNLSPAYPRNYEIWYTHNSGVHRQLSRKIREIIDAEGTISDDQLENLYHEFLSADNLDSRVEDVSNSMLEELKRVIDALDDVKDSAGVYGDSLSGAAQKLINSDSGDSATSLIQGLVQMTRKMESKTQSLEAKLAESRHQIDSLHQNLETARSESMTDSLTGVANRKQFDQTLSRALMESEETGQPLSLVIGDIDHFKKFNDTWGHQTGDQVLRLVAHTLRTNVKGKDLAARYGGEEFALVLPNTELQDAVTVAEQVREAIKGKELVKKSTNENLGTVTMSMGVSNFKPGDTAEKMIARADAVLYMAKRAGRDRVFDQDQIPASSLEDVA